MIAIVNYGLGNLHSVKKAVEFVGGKAFLTDDAKSIIQADKIILPGVGAFQDGMDGLESRGLVTPIIEAANAGKLFLGICLGMQLLFEESEEQGHHIGLGLIEGKVKFFDQPDIKVPQIGWNQLQIQNKDTVLLQGIEDGDYVYFNHGYYCEPLNPAYVIASTDYGTEFAASVQKHNLFGVQFHPEKSQSIGLKILKNFVEN
jgi:glutamine amidotransferase